MALDQPCQARQEMRHRELRKCAASNARNTALISLDTRHARHPDHLVSLLGAGVVGGFEPPPELAVGERVARASR